MTTDLKFLADLWKEAETRPLDATPLELLRQAREERGVDRQLAQAPVAHGLEDEPGVPGGFPEPGIDALPQLVRAVMPAPTQIERERRESLQLFRQLPGEIMLEWHLPSPSCNSDT